MKLSKCLVIAFFLFLFTVSFLTSCGDDDDDSPGDDDDDNDNDNDNNDNNDDDNNDDDDTQGPEPVDLVNMFMGTGGLGYGAAHLHPGPQMPNGMVRPGPDTSLGPFFYLPEFQHYSGYCARDTHIRGFSQNRMIGTGDSDLGNIRLMPILGISDDLVRDTGYLSPITPGSQFAQVGRYRVQLEKTDIIAEMTAARRATLYRFSYPVDAAAPYLVIDVCGSIRPGDATDAEVSLDLAAAEIVGSFWQQGEFSEDYGGMRIYFALRVSESFADYGTFDEDQISPQSLTAAGDDIGAYVGFDPAGRDSVLVKIGVSFLGIEEARGNLDAEIPDFDFADTLAQNRDAWRERLGQVEIAGGNETQRRLFYTSFYRSFIMPTLFTESGNQYLGFDDAAHIAEGFSYYTDMSLWDTFRTLHPLITLLDPALSRDFVISLVKMSQQGGYLPRWPMGKGYTNGMIATHADSVIAEAYGKGITDFDVQTAYEGMYLHATQDVPHAGRADLSNYLTLGYCTTDNTGGAASRTLEYAYDDFCISQLATALGHEENAAIFAERSRNFENIWDNQTQFMRGRDSAGNWYVPFWPLYPWVDEYVQGNAWHWLWFVPHDVPGLIDLFGSPQAMVDKLETLFENSANFSNDALPNLYYWHGNQPDLHAVYMFNEAGRPDLTQKWVRHILEKDYADAPNGLAGNEDGGTLVAWYVFSAIGLFPLNPCIPRYQIGSPLFDQTTLHLPGGDFVIIAENNSAQNVYIQSAFLNGQPLSTPWLEHTDLAAGGTLHLIMGPAPSAWGIVQ